MHEQGVLLVRLWKNTDEKLLCTLKLLKQFETINMIQGDQYASPSPRPIYLRASTVIGKEKLRILFFHSCYAKVFFIKNQYQQQVFQTG